MKRRMRFITWAKKDPEDTTKIIYTLKTADEGTLHFTSDDEVEYSIMQRIRYAWIERIEKVDGAWEVVLYED